MKNLPLVLAVSALAACFSVPTGLEEHLNLLADDGIVATVTCPSPLAVLGEGDCAGWNANGTQISFSGLTPLSWDSSADNIVQSDQGGHIVAIAAGVSTICATGINGSKKCVVVTVS